MIFRQFLKALIIHVLIYIIPYVRRGSASLHANHPKKLMFFPKWLYTSTPCQDDVTFDFNLLPEISREVFKTAAIRWQGTVTPEKRKANSMRLQIVLAYCLEKFPGHEAEGKKQLPKLRRQNWGFENRIGRSRQLVFTSQNTRWELYRDLQKGHL